ncbi:hypothetical protein PC120_g3847 [Phytophthora cactorum]|nr:hypothetical protein PC120_g3847 [Phytophthora cactorum]
MTHLQSLQTFDQEAIDKAFVIASRNGKMDAVKYLCDIRGKAVAIQNPDLIVDNRKDGFSVCAHPVQDISTEKANLYS